MIYHNLKESWLKWKKLCEIVPLLRHCVSVSPSLPLSIFPSLNLSISLSLCLYFSISISHRIFLPVSLSHYFSVSVSSCLSVYISLGVFVSLSLSISVSQSLCVSVYLFRRVSLSLLKYKHNCTNTQCNNKHILDYGFMTELDPWRDLSRVWPSPPLSSFFAPSPLYL